MEIYRQGDVIIKKINQKNLTDNFIKKEDLVLAEGEMTGHAHRVVSGETELYWDVKTGFMFLHVKKEAEIYHEEHESIKLPQGFYEIEKQVEWDWFSKLSRKVAD